MRLTEDNIADYADTLVRRVRDGGIDLDYSVASLTTLENLIRSSDDAFRSPDLTDFQRDISVFYPGCYLGEVLARNLGGVWRFEEDWPESSLVFSRQDGTGVQCFPFRKMFRRVTEGPEENDLTAYFRELSLRIAGGIPDLP
ncbi:MAG: hypothetical protein SFU56_01020 [Capsulimonadales bacterium]|nr:hypothetical protein [Capsulimonadales bacterium]